MQLCKASSTYAPDFLDRRCHARSELAVIDSWAVSSDPIRTTIERYQATFGRGDRHGWLALFVDDATLEDPVGTPARVGRDDIGVFWDEIHRSDTMATVRMVQGPAVCGLEALWAFEVRVGDADESLVIPVIDHGTFAPDGRIRRIRAFWNLADLR